MAQVATLYRKYRPANGSEGRFFMARFCFHCRKDSEAAPCPILGATLGHNVNDPAYPQEWIEGPDGPVCTAFVRSPLKAK